MQSSSKYHAYDKINNFCIKVVSQNEADKNENCLFKLFALPSYWHFFTFSLCLLVS